MENTVLLFISKESATYHYTRRQVESACSGAGGKAPVVKVIDIAEQPAMAEKYNIEALPTIIIGARRYVGAATSEVLSSCMGISKDTAPTLKGGSAKKAENRG